MLIIIMSVEVTQYGPEQAHGISKIPLIKMKQSGLMLQ